MAWRVMGAIIGTPFLLLGLILTVSALAAVWAGLARRRQCGLAIDGWGIWWRDTQLSLMVRVPWNEIRRADLSAETSSANGHVDFYFTSPDIVARYPELKRIPQGKKAKGQVALIAKGRSHTDAYSLRLRIQTKNSADASSVGDAIHRFAPHLVGG